MSVSPIDATNVYRRRGRGAVNLYKHPVVGPPPGAYFSTQRNAADPFIALLGVPDAVLGEVQRAMARAYEEGRRDQRAATRAFLLGDGA